MWAISPETPCFDGLNVWVTNRDDDTAIRLGHARGAVKGVYPVDQIPRTSSLTAPVIWVANSFSDTVSKITAHHSNSPPKQKRPKKTKNPRLTDECHSGNNLIMKTTSSLLLSVLWMLLLGISSISFSRFRRRRSPMCAILPELPVGNGQHSFALTELISGSQTNDIRHKSFRASDGAPQGTFPVGDYPQ